MIASCFSDSTVRVVRPRLLEDMAVSCTWWYRVMCQLLMLTCDSETQQVPFVWMGRHERAGEASSVRLLYVEDVVGVIYDFLMAQ